MNTHVAGCEARLRPRIAANAGRRTVAAAALAALAALLAAPSGRAAPADATTAAVPLFDGLGRHTRKVTTSSREGQIITCMLCSRPGMASAGSQG